jgi:hypothetical protein
MPTVLLPKTSKPGPKLSTQWPSINLNLPSFSTKRPNLHAEEGDHTLNAVKEKARTEAARR